MTDRKLMQQALDALEAVIADVKTTPNAYETQRQAIEALRARLAQPEQEPVAKYSDIVSDGGLDPRNKFDTTPPQREFIGLTDEERKVMWMAADTKMEFAELIEAKLREKNT